MNKSIRNTLLIVAMVFAGSNVAMADQAEIDMLMKAFQDAGVDTGSLDVNVQDGVATLAGNVQNDVTKEKLMEVAKNTTGITEVVDLTTTE